MSLEDRILAVKQLPKNQWSDRICAELGYGAAVSYVNDHRYDGLIEAAADKVLSLATEVGGVVTRDIALTAEKMLMPMKEEAKSYKVHLVSHAHIDMNWMWGFQETVSVTVDTFRTVLDLMKEYPALTFGQSQASTYEIIERYAPEMLDEIKQRIREGRWEVTASTWVETDKNMTSGESLARHIFYTKRYLSKLLDIDPEALDLDFEPDTFGHNISVPEICAGGGIRYYYHCRGNSSDEFIYRWRARSGAELLVWREPEWYNYSINAEMFRKVPQLCGRYGIKSFLSVYGVGDHGGGPTKRDVERLMELASWPIMPTLEFSTYGAFYAKLERERDKFPIIEGELNFIFTGCYTSQSRIKMSNRIAEDRMYESETISAVANAIAGGARYNESYEKAWKKILFNHFHDILPGSGTVETREYALGQFQEAMAAIQTNANCSMRALAEAIDTSSLLIEEDRSSTSQGAAVGFLTGQGDGFRMPCAERGQGKKRIFHLFNSTQFDFDGIAEITVWDYNYDIARAVFADVDNTVVDSKCILSEKGYWGHKYRIFAVHVKVPAMGYATYTLDLKEANDYIAPVGMRGFGHFCDYDDSDIVMENDKVRAVFDHRTMQLLSFIDKKTGENMISSPSAAFRLIHENLVHGMTAWRVGNAMLVENLNETRNVTVEKIDLTSVRKSVVYKLEFGYRSKLKVTVVLDDASEMLDFNVEVEFLEACEKDNIPQLNFIVPVAFGVANYRYDVPFGTIDRPAIEHDVPSNSYSVAIREDGEDKPSVMVVTDTKYGFRGTDQAMAVSLIRATKDPDPYPEYGKHNIRIGVGIVGNADPQTLHRVRSRFVHPLAIVSARSGKGSLPMNGQFMKVDGDVLIHAVKTAEDEEGIIVRLSETNGRRGDFKLTFSRALASASETDLNEKVVSDLKVDGNDVYARIEPFAVKTVLVRFADVR